METSVKQLLLHSSIVFLIALLCGIPYGHAIVHKKSDETIRAWKLAHGSLALGGTTNFALVGVLSYLQVPGVIKWIIAIAFISSVYGFVFGLLLEPVLGERGLSWSGTSANKVVFIGNTIGAIGSLVGAIVLVYAAYKSLI